MRVRRNVWKLGPGDATLEWYGKAVAAMRALPLADPRGWRYQAGIHGRPAPEDDPLAAPEDQTPGDREVFWDQCQHSSSFFLPWHRMYLLHFERLVAAQVAALGGPADWALPYWDYSGDAAWTALPEAFRDAQRADGTENPLYVDVRSDGVNGGDRFLHRRDVDLRACLTAVPTTDLGGFFGPPPANHTGGPFGALEATPHNTIHVAVGGWMLDPDVAALDPIFWLHHANVDRLWEVWLRRDPGHRNLSTPYWLTGARFDFHDASGARVSMTSTDVLDTSALDYGYEDTSDPLTPTRPPSPAPEGAHELVGATTGSVELGPEIVHADVPTPVSAPEFLARAPARPAALRRVILRLENVTSPHLAPVYDVYVELPQTGGPEQHEDHFVGRAAMFGIGKASSRRGKHGGNGVSFSFDVTDLYQRLSAARSLDPRRLRVTFVPVGAKAGVQVRVGRIGLYFA